MKEKIIQAIKNKNLLGFEYNNFYRIVEPHTYGIFSNGNELIVVYQIGGESENGKTPDWKRFNIANIQKLVILNDTFNHPKDGYKNNDPHFRVIYCDL